jgi:outer membrane protein
MKKRIIYWIIASMLCFHPVFAQRLLTLDESRQHALRNNCAVQNSRLEMIAAIQVRKAALTKYFPSILAGGAIFESQDNLMEIATQGGNLPVYDGNPANLRQATQFAYFPSSTMGLFKNGTFGMINVIQPVFAGGRILNGNKLASLGADVRGYKNRLSLNEVLLKTEEQYWLVVSLDDKMKTVQKYEDLLNRLLGQVEDAYRSGIVMKNDVLKVKLKRSEVLLNKSKLENGRKLAVMAFCHHIGVPYDSTLSLKDSLAADGLPETVSVDASEAVKNRAEYQLLLASVRAEKLQTRMKLGEYLPQAGVGVSGLYMKIDKEQERKIGMAFGTVSIPVSGWWEASHALKERGIQEQIAENNFKDRTELLMLQIQKAWQDFSDAYKQVLLSEESLAQADENLKVNQDSYDNGLCGVSDLLEAQAMLQQTKDQLTDAKANYLVKKTTYLQATGR